MKYFLLLFFLLNGEGFFSGNVSLENNGGFCMAQYKMNPIEVLGYSKICLRLKGDQKNYQFRIRAQTNDYFMYIAPFSTTGDWQEIEIPLNEMYPAFRGKKLDMPNFNKATFEEIAFLIGNKKEEEFKLVIDRIELK